MFYTFLCCNQSFSSLTLFVSDRLIRALMWRPMVDKNNQKRSVIEPKTVCFPSDNIQCFVFRSTKIKNSSMVSCFLVLFLELSSHCNMTVLCAFVVLWYHEVDLSEDTFVFGVKFLNSPSLHCTVLFILYFFTDAFCPQVSSGEDKTK